MPIFCWGKLDSLAKKQLEWHQNMSNTVQSGKFALCEDISRAVIMPWAGLGPLILGPCRRGNVYILARPEQIKDNLRF